jgi:opacity protein-like surface antigen
MAVFRVTFLTALAAAVSVSAANAANLPVKSPAAPDPVAPREYDWGGFYAGGLLGYGGADSTHCDNGTCAAPGITYPKPYMHGWLGGATLGFNWQIANWVTGVEGDWSWGKIEGSASSTPTFFCNVAGNNGCVTEVNSIGTLRARAGYAFGKILPYVTAGVAFTRLHASIGTPPLSQDGTTKSNFTWGGGIETALDARWSVKLEYLHVNYLGDFEYDTAHACGPAPSCSVSVRGIDLVRLGVNYRFKGDF